MYLEYSSNIGQNSRDDLKTQSNDKDKERKRQSTGNIKESIQLQFQQKRKKARNERQPHAEVERFQDLFEFHRIAPVVVVPVIHALEIGKFASDAKS